MEDALDYINTLNVPEEVKDSLVKTKMIFCRNNKNADNKNPTVHKGVKIKLDK